jgi:hypothetical protein
MGAIWNESISAKIRIAQGWSYCPKCGRLVDVNNKNAVENHKTFYCNPLLQAGKEYPVKKVS